MSRKRQAKKQHKRQDAWVDELQDLYLRDQDDAFLEAAHGGHQGAGTRDLTPVADIYQEVVDRVLARALEAGDLDRLEALAPRIQRPARSKPLVLVAEAITDLARGRCAAARPRLAALPPAADAAASSGGGLAPLIQGLMALSETDPAVAGRPGGETEQDLDLVPEAIRREIFDLRRLTRALRPANGSGPVPVPVPKLAAPRVAAVGDLLKALDGLRGRGYRPGPKTLAKLTRAAKAITAEIPLGDAAARLTRAILDRVELLAELSDVERALRRRARRGADLHRSLLERLVAPQLPVGLLHDDPPVFLAPLRHALRARWRGLLALVAEHDGDGALAALYAARPRLFAADLETSATLAGPRALSHRTTVEELLQAGKLDRLARFLAARSAEEKDPGRRAELWSFELRTRYQELEARWDEVEDPEDEPDPHPILERVERMSAAIRDAFPADQRPDVARFLRAELLDLTHLLSFCGCFGATAENLRRLLPEDPGLLVVVVAGAVADEDRKARRRLETEIAGRRKVRGDRDVLALLSEVAAEKPARAVVILDSLRPLFAEAFWQEIVAVVAGRSGEILGSGLQESFTIANFDRDMAARILASIERELDPYRPLLSGRPEFEAVALVLECRDGAGRTGSAGGTAKRTAAFLRRFPDIEAALALFGRIKLAVPSILPGSEQALTSTISAVIERLDRHWRLWSPAIAIVSLCADDRQRKALKKKIKKLLRDASLVDEDRQEIAAALEEVERAGKLRHLDLGTLFGDLDADRPARRKQKPGGKPKRRRSKQDPGQLALPGMA